MPKINHMNYLAPGDVVYCEKLETVVNFDQNFIRAHCETCPMWAGSLQGNGVECFYEDPGPAPMGFVRIDDPYEFEQKRRKDKEQAFNAWRKDNPKASIADFKRQWDAIKNPTQG